MAALSVVSIASAQPPTMLYNFVGMYIAPSTPTGYIYFAVEGGTDQILVRATGPTLDSFTSVTGVPDPQLTVYSEETGQAVGQNAGWSVDPAQIPYLTSAFSSANTYSYPVGSLDSAAVLSLGPGLYIVHISSVGNNSGWAEGEIYDLQTAGRVVYAASMILDQPAVVVNDLSAADTVLIRALGPSLGSNYGGAAPSNFSVQPAADSVAVLTPLPVTAQIMAMAGTFPLLAGSLESQEGCSYSGAVQVMAENANSQYVYLELALADSYRQNLAPVFVLPPTGGQFGAGDSLTMTAPALAWPLPTSYVWSKDGVALPNQTGAILNIASLQASDAGDYTLTITNAAGSATSASATVTVEAPVTITQEPVNVVANPGDSPTFSVTATGTGTVTYQWMFDGNPITGATSSTLTLNTVTAAQAGSYSVDITDSAGTTQSQAATLTVNYSRIVNLSVLATAGDASPGVTIGFVVGGSNVTGDTPYLVRAIGPSLAAFGVTDFLPDPNVTVYNSSQTVIGSNDNWGTNAAAITAADSAVGAFTLTNPASLDAAFTSSFAPGLYSAALGGPGSGEALAELYDETPSAGVGAPRLINISARAQVTGSAAALSAGFVISGSGTKELLIRGVGPALAGFGVSGTLATPSLTLYDQSGNTLQTNTGWGSSANISAAESQVGAFSLPANSADCALLVTLGPGQYSASVSGLNGSAGVALVEVYEVY